MKIVIAKTPDNHTALPLLQTLGVGDYAIMKQTTIDVANNFVTQLIGPSPRNYDVDERPNSVKIMRTA